MKQMDYFLIFIILGCIGIILIFLQAVNNATIFNILSQLGFIENSKNGIKSIFLGIIYTSAIMFIGLLFFALRFFQRIISKK